MTYSFGKFILGIIIDISYVYSQVHLNLFPAKKILTSLDNNSKIHMADDFDAALPDEFWLGEAR